MLSLTSAKSGALIGVLVSVTTIPAAANIGVAAAFGEWAEWRGAMLQLALNLCAIVLAGVGTLFIQRRLYMRRRRDHLQDDAAREGGAAARPQPPGRQRHLQGAAEPGMSRTAQQTSSCSARPFAGATAIAALLGAANFGTALTFGELAFTVALMWVLLRVGSDPRECVSRCWVGSVLGESIVQRRCVPTARRAALGQAEVGGRGHLQVRRRPPARPAPCPRRLDQRASSVAAASAAGSRIVGRAQHLGPEHLRGLRRPEALAVLGGRRSRRLLPPA